MQAVPVRDDPDGFIRAEPARPHILVKTAAFTIGSNQADQRTIYVADDAAGSVTFTLPRARVGLQFTFMKGTADTDIILEAPGGAQINGDDFYQAVTDGDGVPVVVEVYCDGSNWHVIRNTGTWASGSVLISAVALTDELAGVYVTDDVIQVTATFNRPVDVTGVPLLPLDINGSPVDAAYVSGSGTAELVFEYTVLVGDQAEATEFDISGDIDLDGGSIKYGVIDADPTLAASDTSAVTVNAA